jgi:hypothetical protein
LKPVPPFSGKKTTMKNVLLIPVLGLLFSTTALAHLADRASKPVAAPDVRLLAENWDFSRTGKGTRAQWADRGQRRVNLSLTAGAAGQAYLISHQTLHGDFDVKVRVNLRDWQAPSGAVVRVALIAARPEDTFQRQTYLVVREARGINGSAPEDDYAGWFMDRGKVKFHPRQPAPVGEKMTVLRLVRRGGRLSAFHWAEGFNRSGRDEAGWVEDAQFEVACTEPLHLMLAISNMAKTQATVFPAVRGSFDLDIHGGRKPRRPG